MIHILQLLTLASRPRDRPFLAGFIVDGLFSERIAGHRSEEATSVSFIYDYRTRKTTRDGDTQRDSLYRDTGPQVADGELRIS